MRSLNMSDQLAGLALSLTDDRIVASDESLQSRDVQLAFEGAKIALMNELAAPEILPYQGHIIDKLKFTIDTEQELLLEKQRSGSTMDQIRQLQVDRVRFLIAAYLRARLKKIERFVMKILLTTDYFVCLSEPEKEFAKQYVDLLAQHFEDSFLNHISERVRSLDDTGDGGHNMVEEPNLDKYVFIRVTNNVGPFTVQNSQQDDRINLEIDDIVLGRYSAFKVILEADQGQLI